MPARAEVVAARAYERRWFVLIVLCASLLAIVVDNSILNVAMPTIVEDLNASTGDLQWIVDGYTLVFAGLLLTAGSLGDRFGRKLSLQFGLVVFGAGSLLAAVASSSGELIAFRAFMGVGAAFLMPATLSIVVLLFPAHERGRAIGYWAGTAGVAIALGPILGGFLLEHFYWGSVFLVNLPIVVTALVAGYFMIPESRDPTARRLDPLGALLSMVALGALLYATIEGPEQGWGSASTLVWFAVGLVALVAFCGWELHTDHPVLDLRLFRNRRFSIGAASISACFFALSGTLFLFTQYFQFLLRLSPLAAGVRLLAAAIPSLLVAPLSARLIRRVGSKLTIALGLVLAAVAMVVVSTLDSETSYFVAVALALVLLASGVSLCTPASTDAVMGSLPLAQAGVGSAVNDTTRMIGAATGIAVIGSVMRSVYSSNLDNGLRGTRLPVEAVEAAREGLGNALLVARDVGGRAGARLVVVADRAFVEGLHTAMLLPMGVLLLAAVAALAWMPSRARREDLAAQAAEHDATWGLTPTAGTGTASVRAE